MNDNDDAPDDFDGVEHEFPEETIQRLRQEADENLGLVVDMKVILESVSRQLKGKAAPLLVDDWSDLGSWARQLVSEKNEAELKHVLYDMQIKSLHELLERLHREICAIAVVFDPADFELSCSLCKMSWRADDKTSNHAPDCLANIARLAWIENSDGAPE